jgi:hypothetical protein
LAKQIDPSLDLSSCLAPGKPLGHAKGILEEVRKHRTSRLWTHTARHARQPQLPQWLAPLSVATYVSWPQHTECQLKAAPTVIIVHLIGSV